MKKIISLFAVSAMVFVGFTAGCGQKNVNCTKIVIKPANEAYQEIEVTDEMNTKLLEYYSNISKGKKVNEKLAIQDEVHVYFSDGCDICTDTNDTDYVGYNNGKKNYIITVDQEFKNYLVSLVEKQ